MRFQITSAGYAAAFAQSNQGPEIRISKFRVGAAFGYSPQVIDDALHGATLYTGASSGYRILGTNQAEFSIIMEENVGSFEFGEIGLYLPDDTLFALGTLQKPQYKVAYPDADFNRYHVRIRLTLNDVIPKIELVVNQLVAGSIWELDSVELLPLPDVAMTNAYLCHSKDANGNDALATLNPITKVWTVHSHMRRVEVGTVAALNSSATQVTGGTGKLRQSDYAVGRYLFQVTSGPNSGQIRQVTNLGGGTAAWTMPLSVSPGDTYELLRDSEDNTGAAEDAAFFYSLLGSNQ